MASGDHAIMRVPGRHAAAVAACVLRTGFPERGGGTVVVAGPDARLGALALVHAASHDAPLLLTAADALSSDAAAELERMRPDRVLVSPGVDDAVVEDLATRLEGATIERIAPARVVRAGDADLVVVAADGDESSALVAASVAARRGGVLALVRDGDPLGDAVGAGSEVVVVGGYGAVDEATEAELRAIAGEARRLSGADAQEVAASAARAYPGGGRLVLSSGRDGAIAVAAAHLAVVRDAALVWSGADWPGRGTDRLLRLGALRDAPGVDLVGDDDELSASLVEALEARHAEAEDGGPLAEIRGVWIHLFDDTLKTRRGVDEMLDRVAAANLNTVVVEVVRRHDAYYVSDVLPRTPDPALEADLDLLERVATGGRDRGLSVHAWAPVAPAYHHVYDRLELPRGHVWREHGPRSAEPWVTFRHDGSPGEYLDIGVPGVHDLVVATFAELARYDVDAVHHDYIRYDGRATGYNPIALARFREETGRSDRPAPDDAQFSAWRRAQTRALAERVAEAVREVNPDVAISMAANTMGSSPRSAGGYERTRTWSDVFQDWPSWHADGLVDVLMPMHYFQESHPERARWYREWVEFTSGVTARCREARDGPCVAAIGIGAWLNPTAHSERQIAVAHERTRGSVIFSYQQTVDREPYDALLVSLRDGLFRDPAPPPRLR